MTQTCLKLRTTKTYKKCTTFESEGSNGKT